MSFIARLSQRELISFYKSLYDMPIICIKKPFFNENKNVVIAYLGIKLGCNRKKNFRIIRLTDFILEEYELDGKIIENNESNNEKWKEFLTIKFGDEYILASPK